jgi:hypothetical protein
MKYSVPLPILKKVDIASTVNGYALNIDNKSLGFSASFS